MFCFPKLVSGVYSTTQMYSDTTISVSSTGYCSNLLNVLTDLRNAISGKGKRGISLLAHHIASAKRARTALNLKNIPLKALLPLLTSTGMRGDSTGFDLTLRCQKWER